MFPAITGCFCPSFSISNVSIVVVVLPLDPVIPTNGASEIRYANSTSVTIGICFSFAATNIGLEYGIPGFFTTREIFLSNNSKG